MRGRGVPDGAERGIPAQPSVRARHCTWERGVDLGSQFGAVAESDQVDVLAETTVHEVRAGESGAADEVEPVRETVGQHREQMRDEVVAFHLFRRNPEPDCDNVAFVDVHGLAPAQISARRMLATIRCSRASSSSRSRSLRR